MRNSLLSIAMCVLGAAGHADQKIGDTVVDCYCTDSTGDRVEIGESICLVVDGRSFIAKCEMALNNPIWRDTGASCNLSSINLNDKDIAVL